MKRSGPPKRKKALQADPEANLAWRQRSVNRVRQKARSAPRGPRKPLKAGKPGGKRLRIPVPTRQEAMARTRGKCAECGRKRANHLHHVLPRSKFPEWELESRNLLPLCFGCHADHESANRRVRRGSLPDVVRLWATAACGWYVERYYPTNEEDRPDG